MLCGFNKIFAFFSNNRAAFLISVDVYIHYAHINIACYILALHVNIIQYCIMDYKNEKTKFIPSRRIRSLCL